MRALQRTGGEDPVGRVLAAPDARLVRKARMVDAGAIDLVTRP